MDHDNTPKNLQPWERLMYAALGAAVTLALSSPNDFAWVGIIWLFLEVLTTTNGYYLLLSKHWRAQPPSRQKLTLITGYLSASWLLLLVPISLGVADWYLVALGGYTLFLAGLLWRAWKQITNAEELFP